MLGTPRHLGSSVHKMLPSIVDVGAIDLRQSGAAGRLHPNLEGGNLMSVQAGIVGLPNVGKSTLFNALTSAGGAVDNYPFCTIEPNVGVTVLPDSRLEAIVSVVKPEEVVPATLEFVDIAGLVKGASQGEGLGNQFLSHIRQVEAMAHVVRCFEDENVAHVSATVDPLADITVVETELLLADLQTLSKRIERQARYLKTGEARLKEEMEALQFIQDELQKGTAARRLRGRLTGFPVLTRSCCGGS